MKVTSDNKQFLFNRVKKIILCFEDGCEVVLDQVKEWDFDLYRCNCSDIDFTNMLVSKEIINRFCTNKERIKFVHIEGEGYELSSHLEDTVIVDMQCDMYIRKLRLNGDIESATEMRVQLEGKVE